MPNFRKKPVEETEMTPEQIEKEREAFESYIMAAYTDPKTGILKRDWKLKRDGEGYFWRNPSTAWKAWIARATQNEVCEVEDLLNWLASKMDSLHITFSFAHSKCMLIGCRSGEIYGEGATVVDCLNGAISKGNL